MSAIPTVYAGVQMRSRLEATWAAFFDEMCIDWEYEPIDMNGWIPDFAIWMMSRHGSDRLSPNPMYVEVKSIWSSDEAAAKGAIEDMDRNHVSGLLVGNSPDGRFLGWVRLQCKHACEGECYRTDSLEEGCLHAVQHKSGNCEPGIRALYAGILPGGFDWDETRGQFSAMAGDSQARCPLRFHVAFDATADWVNQTACCGWWADGFDGEHAKVEACVEEMWARAKNKTQWRPPR